jgi:DegV family protein with EDD domain
VGDFLNAFAQEGEKIFIGIGSKFSATTSNATSAVEENRKDNIEIVDSASLSSGVGQLALLAADLRDLGLGRNEIAKEIRMAIPKVRVSFLVETLDYLYKGGRCSAIQNIVGSLLSIRPIIEVRQDGTMGVKTKMRTSRLKVLQYMIEQISKDAPNISLKRIFITHTGCDLDANYIKSEILQIFQPEELFITTAGSVIASHCGPDTIGIIYMLK